MVDRPAVWHQPKRDQDCLQTMACPCKRYSVEVPGIRRSILIRSLGESQDKGAWCRASVVAGVVQETPVTE